MKCIKSYKQHQITEKYDVIVIGSGIGGLGTAAILAKEGKKVLVLERHYTAGGYTHVFKRRGYEWDVGIHYIGEVHRPHTEINRLFKYVTDGQLEWAHMGKVYDKIMFGEKVYEFHAGKEEFVAKMKEYFPAPKDQEAIDQYIDLIYQSQRSGRMFFAEKALPPVASWAVGGRMRKKMLSFSNRTTLEVLQSITDNKELIGVLCGQYGDYGLPPSQSSFAIHAMVVKHFIHGGNFPIGGCMHIVNSVAKVITDRGGLVLTNAEVSEIVVKNNKAIGVKMADGKEIHAPITISSAGVINTFKHLLPAEVQYKHKIGEQLKTVEPSASHLCLYIGFNHSVKELGLQKANYWIYPDNYDHDENVRNFLANPSKDLPVTYISFPAAKDPDWENRYPGKSTVDIITIAPYEWFKQWEDKRWMKRGEEYEAFKEQFAQRMLEKLYQVEPQLKGKVDYYELSTPLSTKHFVNYQKGEIYGLDHTPQRFQQKFLRVHTPVKKLYLTGQDVVSAGIGGALAAGMITASAILKKDLSSKIRKATEVTDATA